MPHDFALAAFGSEKVLKNYSRRTGPYGICFMIATLQAMRGARLMDQEKK